MTPDQEYQILAIAFSFLNDFYELGRVDATPGWIQKDFPRRRMFRKQIKTLRYNFAHVAIGIA